MSIEELLEQFDEVLDGGMKLPGKRTLLDSEKIRELVDDIRLNMPAEIKQAKNIVNDRTEIITRAKSEADEIIRRADERAAQMVAQEEITRLAEEKAREIVAAAQSKSREMRKAAQEFVDDLMQRADEGLTSNLAEVRKTRASLKQPIPGSQN